MLAEMVATMCNNSAETAGGSHRNDAHKNRNMKGAAFDATCLRNCLAFACVPATSQNRLRWPRLIRQTEKIQSTQISIMHGFPR